MVPLRSFQERKHPRLKLQGPYYIPSSESNPLHEGYRANRSNSLIRVSDFANVHTYGEDHSTRSKLCDTVASHTDQQYN
jgi:hypothetical protein